MAGEKRPDAKGISYFDITDFSPGIFDNSAIAFGSATGVPGIFPAPPGAADATATFGCIAQRNGGLGPLPAFGGGPGQAGLSLSQMGIGASGQAGDITALTNSFQSTADELVYAFTFIDGGGTGQNTHFWSYVVGTATANSIESQDYNFAAGEKNFCCFPFPTIINDQPVICLPLAAPAGPNSNLMNYPSVGAPTTFSVDTIATNASADGTAFGHQGRIVVLQIMSRYGWPVGFNLFPNEAFNYTDPPQTGTWPAQFELFGPESPFGYGVVTSVSAGELFCVKKRGGAIIIQGDLNNPTVTTLTGVKSTGTIYGRPDSDQNGSYYCVENEGAWVWNGGNSSQKISTQLDDNFFEVAHPISDTFYYGYYCQRWGDWMLFSNNWVFDSVSGSWWRIEDPSVRSFFYFVPAFGHEFMFAALPTVTATTEKFLWEYDRTIPRSSFTWQSLPVKLPSEDHSTTVRELVIRASNPYGDAAPQIIATLLDDKGNTSVLPTWTMTTGINTVQEIRINSAVKQTTTIAVHLACSGTTYAPVVHGLSMGSRQREHLGAN